MSPTNPANDKNQPNRLIAKIPFPLGPPPQTVCEGEAPARILLALRLSSPRLSDLRSGVPKLPAW